MLDTDRKQGNALTFSFSSVASRGRNRSSNFKRWMNCPLIGISMPQKLFKQTSTKIKSVAGLGYQLNSCPSVIQGRLEPWWFDQSLITSAHCLEIQLVHWFDSPSRYQREAELEGLLSVRVRGKEMSDFFYDLETYVSLADQSGLWRWRSRQLRVSRMCNRSREARPTRCHGRNRKTSSLSGNDEHE